MRLWIGIHLAHGKDSEAASCERGDGSKLHRSRVSWSDNRVLASKVALGRPFTKKIIGLPFKVSRHCINHQVQEYKAAHFDRILYLRTCSVRFSQ